MPKIGQEQLALNRRRIESAALALFTKQGFHGTRTRDIGARIGLSTGVIYTYFKNKEAIFTRLAERYRAHMTEWLEQTARQLPNPLSKPDLIRFATAIEHKMRDDPQYLLLLLSDVVEFENRHFIASFLDVPAQLRRVWGKPLDRVRRERDWRGEDPAFVLASLYLYFFTYALVERQMRGRRHLGLKHSDAIGHLVDLLSYGLWPSPRPIHTRIAPAERDHAHRAARTRVQYLRFLSGRLWHSPPDTPPDGRARHKPTGLLFLPELPRNRIDDTQLRIEAAALELFTRQGFHGTNIRDIAARAKISQGGIYKYYAGKEAIYEGLVAHYKHCMAQFLARVLKHMTEPFSRDDLRLFANAIRSTVYEDAYYWLLLYIDVIEFDNRHFADSFRDIPAQFRHLLGEQCAHIQRTPGWCGLDPGLALAFIYFYFCTYFCVEQLMHGDCHLGVDDDQAIDRLIEIFLHGIRRSKS